MATEKQFAYFSSIFEKEAERTRSLRDIAKIYVGLTSIYTAFLTLTSDKMQPTSPSQVAIYCLVVLAFLGAFLCSIQVLQVASYERASNPVQIIGSFDSTPPEDSDFFDDRIVDFTVASQRNLLVNNRKSKYLATSGYLILFGLAVHAAYAVAWTAQKAGLL